MNKRIFVEKRPQFDVESQKLLTELQEISPLTQFKQYIIYDVFGLDESLWDQALRIITNQVSDVVTYDNPIDGLHSSFAMEYLPGQYDQRADSAQQAIQLVTGSRPAIRTGKLFSFDKIEDAEVNKIKNYLINSVDSQEKDLSVLNEPTIPQPSEVPVIDGFTNFLEEELKTFHKEWSFSFDLDDLKFIQNYFQTEKRNPTETELKVLDTYWSDHCRHTTFFTELTDIEFEGSLARKIEEVFKLYNSNCN